MITQKMKPLLKFTQNDLQIEKYFIFTRKKKFHFIKS